MDHLIGLKENVIIGKLIPAGSGLAMYRQVNPREEGASQDEGGKDNAYAAVAAAVNDLQEQEGDEEVVMDMDFEEGGMSIEEDEVVSISFDD